MRSTTSFVHCFHSASFKNVFDRRFDFVNYSQFHVIFMNIANCQSRRQLNEIENPHQFIAASSHVTDGDCEINNHFMNFFPFKLDIVFFLKKNNKKIINKFIYIYHLKFEIFAKLQALFFEHSIAN